MKTLLVIFLACLPLSPLLSKEIPALSSTPVKRITLPEVFFTNGIIEAVHRSTISAQTNGEVIDIKFDVEDIVTQEQVLIRLRDTEQKAQLNRAKASLLEAQARLNEAQTELNRIKQLHQEKLASDATLDNAQTSVEAATSRIKIEQAKLDSAQEQLRHTVIKAPYSGIVVKRHVELGEIAQPGQSLMTGLSLEQLRVQVDLPQSMIADIREIEKAQVLLPKNGSLKELMIKNIIISPQADPLSHTFQLRLILPKNTPELYPGMFVKVGLIRGQTSKLVVPFSTLVQRSEITALYVTNDQGKLSMRYVKTGRPLENGLIEILAGLTEGEQVANDPIQASLRQKQQTSH